MNDSDARRNDPVVYLVTVANEPLAQMWVETLRQNGITAMAKPLGPGFGAWGSAFSFEHELYVLESQHEAALAVIREIEGPEIIDIDE